MAFATPSMASYFQNHDTEFSEDEGASMGAQESSFSASRKRSTRACDQCRKTKSKCERSEIKGEACRNCAAAEMSCQFLGPSHKRGPPKGYIQVIERRLQQVEAILGAVMGSPDPRARSLMADLSKDSLARDILQRVNSGPFGPAGDLDQSLSTTKKELFAAILRVDSENANGDGSSRSRRQSRISREQMSSGSEILVSPTESWQEKLREGLSKSTNALPDNSEVSASAFVQRPRLNRLNTDLDQGPWFNCDGLYTMEKNEVDEEPVDQPEEDVSYALGRLSLDQISQDRYHNHASALWLVHLSNRPDSRHQGENHRIQDSSAGFIRHPSPITFPPLLTQERLIELYFTHVHPVFPVLDKQQFLENFHMRKQIGAQQNPKETCVKMACASDLVLFAVLAISARYAKGLTSADESVGAEVDQHLVDLDRLFYESYHSSSPSTCQALLLIAYRDIGTGSWDQGWIHVGMAIRMAQDLGIDRDANIWKQSGADVFSSSEIETRKRIWHACFFADRFVSVLLGRSVAIRDPSPGATVLDENHPEESEPLHFAPRTSQTANSKTMFPRVISYVNTSAALSNIVGDTLEILYTMKYASHRADAVTLARRLEQWLATLPVYFRYEAGRNATVMPPNILELHCHYWWAKILIHRAFLHPKIWSGDKNGLLFNAFHKRELEQCVAAANHICTIVTSYEVNYSLQNASVFMLDYILNAGLIHALVVNLNPTNVQATIFREQCRTALKQMEIVWPAAKYAEQVLYATDVDMPYVEQQVISLPSASRNPQKRSVEEAFGNRIFDDRVPDGSKHYQATHGNTTGQDSTMMASMLGIDVPGHSSSSLWSWNVDEAGSPSIEPTTLSQFPAVHSQPSGRPTSRGRGRRTYGR